MNSDFRIFPAPAPEISSPGRPLPIHKSPHKKEGITMEQEPLVDHDLLIRIDENVKAIKDRCAVCSEELDRHVDRIAVLEGDVRVIRVRNSVWSAVAVGVSGAVAAALKWLK